MRWLSLSSIRSWKKLQHPPILGSSSSIGKHNEMSFSLNLLSTSAAARGTASDNRKSNPVAVEGYIETIRYQKSKSCRGLLPDFMGLSRLMSSYSKIGCTEYGFGVLGLILKLGYTPHVVGISCLMNALCQQLRINEAALLFQKMKTHLSCKPDIVTFRTLLKGLCLTGNSRIALNLHEQIVDGTHDLSGDLQLETRCYNTLIDGLCKDGLIDKANELFLEMRKKDVRPDVITYTIVIDGLSRAGKWEEAKALFHEMLDHALEPDVVTFNMLINALAKMGKSKEAKELFLQMVQSGQIPTVVTYSSLMDCFYREGNIEELKDVFVSMDRHGITPNVVTYNILIKGFCKLGMIDEANAEYRRMIQNRVKPTIITINALLEGMLLKGMVSEAIELKSEITVHNLTPDLCTYNILIDGLGKNGHIQEAVKLFDTMSDSKLKPDVCTYNSLIDGLCKVGKLEKALLLFDRMSSDNVVPDCWTYNILINGLCKAEKIVKAEKLFDMMSDSKLKTDVVTYNCLINGLCKAGKLEKGLLLFVRMSSDGVVPNVTTYTILIDGLCKAEKIIQAEKLFVDMEKNGILPNVCTFGALIHGFCRMGDTNKVIELLQMMAHRQIKLDDAIDDMVISRLLKEEKYDEFLNLLPTFPQRIEVQISAALKGCCKHGMIHEAIEEYRRMIRKGVKPVIITINALLEGMLLKGMATDESNSRLIYIPIYEEFWSIPDAHSMPFDPIACHFRATILQLTSRPNSDVKAAKKPQEVGCLCKLARAQWSSPELELDQCTAELSSTELSGARPSFHIFHLPKQKSARAPKGSPELRPIQRHCQNKLDRAPIGSPERIPWSINRKLQNLILGGFLGDFELGFLGDKIKGF
ncbi:unnamed protein product [Rhodiola kirilowii]